MAVTGLAGTSVRTIAAGDYWPAALVGAFIEQLEAGEVALGGSDGFTAATSWGESGDGTILIEHDSSTNFAVTAWGSTQLRDWLGFSGTLSGASEYQSTRVCQSVYLADCDYDNPRGATVGARQIDRSVNVSPTGVTSVVGYGYPSRRRLGRVTWPMVGVARTLEAYESVAGESFEAWFLNTHGRVAWFGAGPLVRFYWDADASDYAELRLTEPLRSFDPDRVDPQWIGLWPIVIDGFVVAEGP